MSQEVQFDEDKFMSGSQNRNIQANPEQSGMIGWLMKRGIAKTAGAAQGILVGVMIVCFIGAYIFYKMFS